MRSELEAVLEAYRQDAALEEQLIQDILTVLAVAAAIVAVFQAIGVGRIPFVHLAIFHQPGPEDAVLPICLHSPFLSQ
jgi:hypothetical protein